jgi:hypothetical protein
VERWVRLLSSIDTAVGKGKGALECQVFNGCRVSVWEDKKYLEMGWW